MQFRRVINQLRFHRGWIPLCVLVWGLTVGVGLARLNGYETTPGRTGTSLSKWPIESLIRPSDRQCTLVMFIHDCCPCTRASLAELAKIMARSPVELHVYVVALEPGADQVSRCRTNLLKSAAMIPGVTVVVDPNGDEARRFGALTSAHTFLYDENGNLLFDGGITAGRGHSGDNRGQTAVLTLITDHQNPTFLNSRTSVFGCPLFFTLWP